MKDMVSYDKLVAMGLPTSVLELMVVTNSLLYNSNILFIYTQCIMPPLHVGPGNMLHQNEPGRSH
jgi:hypothetical protein